MCGNQQGTHGNQVDNGKVMMFSMVASLTHSHLCSHNIVGRHLQGYLLVSILDFANIYIDLKEFILDRIHSV